MIGSFGTKYLKTFSFMKTVQFRAVRVICTLFITAMVLNCIAYFGLCMWKRELLDLEKIMLYGNFCTLRSFSLYLGYVNLINSFLFGYAFNIASKTLLQMCLWFTVGTLSAGGFSCFYLKSYSLSNIKAALSTSFFSVGTLSIRMMERYPNMDFFKIQQLYEEEYSFVLKYFLIFELISLSVLVSIGICGLIARFMTIHEYKAQIPHIQEETVGSETLSLKPMRNLISIRT